MGAVPPPPIQPRTQPGKSNTTLIVLLVVGIGMCLIVLVLAAILFPVFSQARVSAQRSVTMKQAADISRYLFIYAMDNDSRLPHEFVTDQDLTFAVSIYAGGPGDMFYSHNPFGGQFMPNSHCAGIDLDTVVAPESTILIFESAPWDTGNGRVVSFLTGQVLYMKPFSEERVTAPMLMGPSGTTQD